MYLTYIYASPAHAEPTHRCASNAPNSPAHTRIFVSHKTKASSAPLSPLLTRPDMSIIPPEPPSAKGRIEGQRRGMTPRAQKNLCQKYHGASDAQRKRGQQRRRASRTTGSPHLEDGGQSTGLSTWPPCHRPCWRWPVRLSLHTGLTILYLPFLRTSLTGPWTLQYGTAVDAFNAPRP